MTQQIAVIDGSVYSESVCDHTAWITQRTGGSVAVTHVLGRRDISSEPANLSGSIGLGARTDLLEELAELDGQKARLAQKSGRATLEGAKARLIIIGKRGEAAGFSSGHLGSNLERVVRSTNKLVLVASRAFKPVNRLLIAFDGGPSSLKAVNYIASSKVFHGIECHLLSVGEPTPERQRGLTGAAVLLRDAGLVVEHQCLPGQPETVIAGKVEKDHFDLLVMGAYGHSRIRSMIIGSTTTQMLLSCKIPVLLFR